MNRVTIPTVFGEFIAWFSARGLARLQFPSPRKPEYEGNASAHTTPPQLRQWQKQTAAALTAVLAGRPIGALPPLDWSEATPFQQRVWTQMRRIAPGQVRTYGQIARAIGRPNAARAVGGACGANPIPVLVPCHRVTAAGGALGGFSGGLDWKIRLLEIEGVPARQS